MEHTWKCKTQCGGSSTRQRIETRRHCGCPAAKRHEQGSHTQDFKTRLRLPCLTRLRAASTFMQWRTARRGGRLCNEVRHAADCDSRFLFAACIALTHPTFAAQGTQRHCERGGVQAWYEASVARRAASESTWCAQRRMCIAVEGETARPLQSRIPAAGIATTTASCPACSRDRHGANKAVPWLADAFGTKRPSLRCGSFSAYKQPPCATTERGVCPSFATLPATRGGSRR